MKRVEIIIRPGKLEAVRKALESTGHLGITISQVEGQGKQKGTIVKSENLALKIELHPKTKLEIVVSEADLEAVIEAVSLAARTGQVGDGKIFVSPVSDAVRIRTGERGPAAI